ncbi:MULTISPECIES: hypothetical protein [unclassified Fibrobacter]|uniref:hypothetical protein n=1 Tax=unclassified Fibrobacter TaxID=2634177 RepID=UPI00091E2A0C|nr:MULTISPECIES: hypothetical protein [unclassified Fibrobacter]OWV05556.1 hypothetical protein B7993_08125 [Fibrobacter sp. UWH3]OWV16517.1 hypothetical protein B7992_02030 [Fibrobacter sp. UWH1]SHK45881.1 hypothetical protein SAMN05720765_102282 [Fibrobacter sp. UWH6]
MATKERKTFNYILLDIAWQKCRAFDFRVFVLNLAIEIWKIAEKKIMKKILLILMSFAWNVFALDCLNIFDHNDFGGMYAFPGYVLDSTYRAYPMDGWDGESFFTDYYYETSKLKWDGNTLSELCKSKRVAMDDKVEESNYTCAPSPATISYQQKDEYFSVVGDFPDRPWLDQRIFKDSIFILNYEYTVDSIYKVIKNDSIFIYANRGPDDDGESREDEKFVVVRDPANNKHCLEYEYYYNGGDWKIKNNVSKTYTLEETENGFVVKEAASDNDYTIVYFVKIDSENTTSIARNKRPSNIRKFQYFDLLGRPSAKRRNRITPEIFY